MRTGARSSERLDLDAGVAVLRSGRLSAIWRVSVHDSAPTVKLRVVIQCRADPDKDGVVPEGDFFQPRKGKKDTLVPKHGNTLLLQLVVDGMKLQPCRPS